MVIAVSAILAGAAISKFVNVGASGAFTASRRFAADIRYAQRLATTLHQPCGVVVNSGTSYTVFKGTVATPATDPLTQQTMVVDLAATSPNVTIAPSGGSVTFDVRGVPQAGFTPSFTVGGRAIAIAAETGEVRY